MKLGINSTITFGKYSGKAVHQVLSENPGYLCWLRENAKLKGFSRSFDGVVNGLLDVAITHDPGLGKKYKPWNIDCEEFHDVLIKEAKHRVVREEENKVRQESYNEWGNW